MDPIPNQASVKKSGNEGLIAGMVAVLLIAGGVFAYFNNSNNPTLDQTAIVPADTTDTSGDPAASTPLILTSKYKDGTYSAQGSYQSPGGTETIEVTVTLKDDIVTDAIVTSVLAERPESHNFQGRFIAGFKQYVIGKNISDIQLSKVSGSSLTSGGFNSALGKIQAQAQA